MPSSRDTIFVNRTHEIPKIINFIDGLASDNILIISANSGIGKSRLTKEAQKQASVLSVRVSIGDVPSAIVPDGMVIQKISRILSIEIEKKGGCSLSTYFLKHLPKTLRKSLVKVVIKKLTGWLTDDEDAHDAIEEAVATAIESQSEILDDASPQLTGFASDYIKYCSENFQFCIIIENSHLVDLSSLEFVINILSKKQQIIFEYTSNNSKKFPIDRFLEIFSEQKGKVDLLKLEPLSSNEAVKLIADDIVKMTAFVENQFKDSNGNLRPLVDAAVLLSRGYGFPDQLQNATSELLKTITSDQKFLISLLVLNEGTTTLTDIIEASKIYNIRLTNEEVRRKLSTLIGSLIKQTQINHFEIAHDYIRQIVATSVEFRKFNFLALDCWRRLYQSRFPNVSSGSNDHVLINHFRFAVLSGDVDESIGLIPNLISAALRAVEPTPIVTLLKATLEQAELNSADASQIRLQTISMLFSVGLEEEAIKFIGMQNNDSLIFDLYHVLCLSRLGQFPKAQKIVSSFVKHETGTGFLIITDLLAILTKRNELSSSDGQHQIDQLINKYSKRKHVSIGFIYRAANLFHTPENALPLLERSVEIFEENNDPFQAVVSRLHVATRAAFLGDHARAYDQIERVENSIVEEAGYYDVLLNNRACIDIMSDRVSRQTATLLEHAGSIAKERYSQIAIKINKLLTYSILKEASKADELLLEIEAFIAKNDNNERNLMTHAKYAIFKYHEYMGHAIETNYFERLLRNDPEAPDPVIKLILSGEITKVGGIAHRIDSSMIYPRSLGYWHPDFKGLQRYFV